MAKKEALAPETVEQTNLPATADQFNSMSTKEVLAKLSEAADDKLKEVPTQQALNIDEGDVFNLKYIGIEEKVFNDNEEPKEVAIFEDESGNQLYNGNSFLVNCMKRIEAPNFVRIKGTEKKKSNAGTYYKTFQVFSLM